MTIHGPSGQKVSIALQKLKTPDRISRRWMSRAVMSLKITYPPMYSVASSGGNQLPARRRTTASSSS